MKIGIIGAGKLTQGIIAGWLESDSVKRSQIWAVTKSSKSANRVRKNFGIHCSSRIDPKKLIASDIILLGVKPYHLEEVCRDLLENGLRQPTVIYSVLAGVDSKQLQRTLGQKNPVIVTMTNTPCTVGQGMTTLYKGRYTTAAHMKKATQLFSKVGHVLPMPEKLFHEVTALSASGPAFVYYLMKLMSDAATNQGVPPKKAQELCAQTFLGAATMLLKENTTLEKLISNVTTPGGCTIEGVKALKASRLEPVFKKTLDVTRNKSRLLARRKKT
ncbi:pyrroline-5-carboxylate reductase [bacterium]|nr:pyrroline-5-carboxylate reductase [bacterium]